MSKKANARQNARHEAAHAVAHVRLGNPLVSTDIIRRTITKAEAPSLEDGQAGVSYGYTALADGFMSELQHRKDEGVEEQARRAAIGAAAGIVAEHRAGLGGHAWQKDDEYALVAMAAILGIGESNQDPDVVEFFNECCNQAAYLLLGDDGEAWDRVTAALLRKRSLTGDEVREMVAAVGWDPNEADR